MRSVPLAAALLAGALPAQNALGQPNGFKVDVETQARTALGSTWGDSCVGCCVDRNGNYWVSTGRPLAQTSGSGKLLEFDAAGNFVKAIDQPPVAGSMFGMRDLAYDGKDTIYGGLEVAMSSTVLAFDIVSETFVPARDWRAPAGTAIVRGLAYDPAGNNGRGSMWTTNFNSNPILEFDQNGNVLSSVAVAPFGAVYGLGIDAVARRLWLFSQSGSSQGYNKVRVVGYELDLGSGLPTGTMFFGDKSVAPPFGEPNGGIAGGCEFYLKNGAPTLLLLAQANSDTIYEVGGRFDYGQGCGGSIGMSGDAPFVGNGQWTLTLGHSAASSAALLLGASEGSLGVGPPVFGTNCSVLVGLTPAPLVLPAVMTAAGGAVQPLAVPQSLAPTPMFFQWVEPAGAGPILLSGGGKTIVGYP